MKIVQITYTTFAEFADQNKGNINTFVTDLLSPEYAGINYQVCICGDNKTFIHRAYFETDNDQQLLNALPSFIRFQEQLKSGGCESPPKQERLELIGTLKQLF